MAVVVNVYGKANMAQIKAAEAQLLALKKTVGGTGMTLKSFGNGAVSMGRKMSTYVTLPVVAVGAASVKMAMDFNASFKRISALVGASDKQIAGYKEGVLSMAESTGVGATDLADALFYVTSAGFKGAAAMRVLDASAKASAAGLGDTKTVADAVTSAVNAYGEGQLSASRATDVLIATVREGKMAPEDLAGTLGKVVSVASEMKIPFDQVGAALAAMSRQGIDAAQGTTALRAIMTQTLKPTTGMEDALGKVGLSAAKVRASFAKNGLLPTLEMLKAKFHGNTAAIAQVFGNVRGLTGVLNLTGASAAKNAGIFKRLAGSTGSTAEAFRKSAGDGRTMKQAMETIRGAMIKLGVVLIPVVAKIAATLGHLVTGFMKLPGPAQKAIGALVGIAAVVGPMLLIAGKFALAVTALKEFQLATKVAAAAQWVFNAAMSANPIGLVIIAIAALVAGIILAWKHSETFRRIVLGAWGAIKAAASAIFPPIVAVITGAWRLIKTVTSAVWNGIAGFFRRWGPLVILLLTGPIGILVGQIRKHWTQVKSVTTSVLGAVAGFIRTWGGRLYAIFVAPQVRAVQAGIAAFRRFVSGVQSVISRVVQVVGSVAGKVRSAISAPGKILYEIGSQIVQGLVSGISAAWHFVTEKISSLLHGLNSVAKKLLGISSPSKVFAAIGVQISAGLAAGISSGEEKVAAAAAKVAKAAIGRAKSVAGAMRERSLEIAGGVGLWDATTAAPTGKDALLANMAASKQTMTDWVANAGQLQGKLPKELLKQILSEGVGSAGQVAALAQMTPEELRTWADTWKDIQSLSKTQARTELLGSAKGGAIKSVEIKDGAVRVTVKIGGEKVTVTAKDVETAVEKAVEKAMKALARELARS